MIGFEDILPGIGMFTIIFAKSWYMNWQKNKLKKKLGEKKDSLLIVPDTSFNKYQYFFGGVGILIFGISTYVAYKAGVSGKLFSILGELVKAYSLGLASIYAPLRFKQNFNIVIGENGFIFRGILYLWDEIELIEWDRDIKQKLWALRILKKGESSHVKIYVNRFYKELFDKSLKEKIADKVKYY